MSEVVTVTRILKAADVQALGTTPFELLPGEPDRWYFPLFFRFRKTKGEAYAITGSGAQIGVGNPATGIVAAGLLDQEESTVRFRSAPVLGSSYVDDESAYLGQPTNVIAAGGSFSGDGSDVVVTATFLEIVAL